MRNSKGQFLKGQKHPKKSVEASKKALKGNKHGIKVKDPDLRREAFKQYCAYIASGKPKDAWYFENPLDPLKSLTSKSMERYIKENPSEFPAILKEIAHCKSYEKWFDKGEKLADGHVKGNPSPQTWQVIMRNMFDWEKDNRTTITFEPEVRKLLANWEK